MKKNLIRNILWIALIAVWSFVAGGNFHLGWGREPSMSFRMGFIMGGIAMWIVFFGMGILVYRFAKKNGSADPTKPSLFVLSFFTLCFLFLAWLKQDEVERDRFIQDTEQSFIIYYKSKALAMETEIDDIDRELERMYSLIKYDLRSHPKLEELMKQKRTGKALFEENTLIPALCDSLIEQHREFGYDLPMDIEALF